MQVKHSVRSLLLAGMWTAAGLLQRAARRRQLL